MNKRAVTFAFALLMTLPAAPLADATHGLPEAGGGVAPNPEEVGVPDTGYPVIDNRIREANDAGRAAGTLVDEEYRKAWNQLNGKLQPGFITTYRDGVGGDTRSGGFGQWSEGTAWQHLEDAAFAGSWGYSTGIGPDGTYGSFQRSLLLTPELDLHTNLDVPLPRTGQAPVDDVVPPFLRSLFNAGNLFQYLFPNGELDFLCGTPDRCEFDYRERELCRQDDQDPESTCTPEVRRDHDGIFMLQFAHRYNLAAGRDGVQIMVFTEPPLGPVSPAGCDGDPRLDGTFSEPADPDASCTIVEPVDGYPGAPMALGPQQPGFTASMDWDDSGIDLTPWAERSVWVGFYFASGQVLSPLEFQGSGFDQSAGFYGFQVDELRLSVPAPPAAIHLRPFTSPTFIPDSYDHPLVLPDQPFRVESNIMNVGSAVLNLTVTLALANGSGPSVERAVEVAALRPGESRDFGASFDGLSEGWAGYANVTVAGATRADAALLAQDPERAGNALSTELEAHAINAIVPGEVRLPSRSVAEGADLSVELPVENRGNVPANVTAYACLVDVAAGANAQCTTDLLVDETAQTRSIAPGEREIFQWEVETSVPGQYRFFVGLNDDSLFDPADLEPSFLSRPVQSEYREEGAHVDGVVDDAWNTVPEITFNGWGDHGQSTVGSVRIMNNATHLHLLFGGLARPNLILFDDGGDQLATDGAEDGIRVNATDVVSDLHYEADVAGYVDDDIQAGPMVGRSTRLEVAVPLGNEPGSQDLTVGPGQRLAFMARAGVSNFPDTARATDGGQVERSNVGPRWRGVLPPDGSLSDEMQSWMLVDLAEPNGAGDAAGVSVLSDGFGIGRSPPPLLTASFDDCGTAAKWVQTESDIRPHLGAQEMWTCTAFAGGPTDAMFQGYRPGQDCGGVPCPPYSIFDGRGTRVSNQPGQQTVEDASHTHDENAWLYSPPFDIPADSQPYLLVYHQFATNTDLLDDPAPAQVINNGLSRIHLDLYAEETGWTPPHKTLWLTPEGGYTTYEDVGIDNSMMSRPTPISYIQVGGGKPLPGWWWPTDPQDIIAPGEVVPERREFNGSPWLVSKIPLFGNTHGAAGIESAGRTARLQFVHDRAGAGALTDDFGWRIGGIAVYDSAQLRSNLRVDAAVASSQHFDPQALGLAPGQPAIVNVTVTNDGTEQAVGQVEVIGFLDQLSRAEPLCTSEATTLLQVAPGGNRTVQVPCVIEAGAQGRIRFEARVVPLRGDDFPADDVLRWGPSYPIQVSPDAEVALDVSPRASAAGVPRSLYPTVINRGNVPLVGFDITLEVAPRGAEGATETRRWTLGTPIAVGARQLLSAPGVVTQPPIEHGDFQYVPHDSGTYDAILRTFLAGDLTLGNNAIGTPFRAESQAYENDFGGRPRQDPLVVSGNLEPGGPGSEHWQVAGEGSSAKTLVFRGLGDAPVPANASAWMQLPDFDLTTFRSATLSLRTLFDLEEGFDGARFEVSSDNGTTWHPMRPEPNAQGGLPEGYPSIRLIGSNSFMEGRATQQSIAFTGDSRLLPAADEDGWIPVELNFAKVPGLQRTLPVERLDLSKLSTALDLEETGAVTDPRYFDPSWVASTPDAMLREEYWSIQNLTYSMPAPHSGTQMWWSGSAGTVQDGENPPRILDSLRFAVDLPVETRPDARVVASWWEWAAGSWEHPADAAFGATQTVVVLREQGPALVPPTTVARDSGAWVQRQVDLSAFAGQSIQLEFNYGSDWTADNNIMRRNNRGWFIDDLKIDSVVQASDGTQHSPLEIVDVQDMEDLALDGEGRAGQWSSIAARYPDGAQSAARWTLVEQGVAQSPGGWNIGQVELPGQGHVPAWRFRDDSTQGYPHSAESRLITPVIDLGGADAENLSLEFDHRFGFESILQCPFDGTTGGCFRKAVDAGAVEYQAFDEATGVWGPWAALGQQFDVFPDRLLLDARTPSAQHLHVSGPASCTFDHLRVPDRLTDAGGATPNRVQLDTTGYNALEVSGEAVNMHSHVWAPDGHGYQFEAFESFTKYFSNHCPAQYPHYKTWDQVVRPWQRGTVSYVFSGESNGWEHIAWDLTPLQGQRVRFAFHAATNPSYDGTQPLDGWSLANIAVTGTVLDSKPVKIRLHAATDDSLNDGVWAIDDIRLTGERFVHNVGIAGTADASRQLPGTTAAWDLLVTNSGSAARSDLLFGLALLDSRTKEPIEGAEVEVPELLPAFSGQTPSGLPPGARLYGPFALFGAGAGTSTVPIHVEYELPDQASEVELVEFLLEDRSNEGTPLFLPPVNDFGGVTFLALPVVGRAVQDVPIAPPVAGISSALVAEPPLGTSDQPVDVNVAVRNDGTTSPQWFTRWQVDRIHQKGEADQEGITPRTVELDSGSTEASRIQPGDVSRATFRFTPPTNGLYRITVQYLARDGGPAQEIGEETLEIQVGPLGAFYSVDFSQGAAGWSDESYPQGANGGGSPESVAFRTNGAQFIWGVDHATFAQGGNYCNQPETVCNYGPGGEAIQTVTGLEGIARGPVIDLGRVVEGGALLVLRHNHNFEAGDGARIEAIPLVTPVDGQQTPAFGNCMYPDGSERPHAFMLEPVQGYPGTVRNVAGMSQFIPAPPNPPGGTGTHISYPNRVQPLTNPIDQANPAAPAFTNPSPAFGGAAVENAFTIFDMSRPMPSACSPDQEVVLVNYQLQLQLHTGLLPGIQAADGSTAPASRRGGQGWQIDSIAITPGANAVFTPQDLRLPAVGGAPKRFQLELENLGRVPETYRLLIDQENSQLGDPSWVTLPQATISLAPGQRASVPLLVRVPADANPATYFARVIARSTFDSFSEVHADVVLDLGERALPDLATRLAFDNDLGDTIQAGEIVPMHVMVTNQGQQASRDTRVMLELEAVQTGEATVVGSLAVKALCPMQACGRDRATQTSTFEWSVPSQPGQYRLRATVNPQGNLLESSLVNNAAVMDVLVAPLRRPDLAVTNLDVSGIGADGFVEEGSLLNLTATVVNNGHDVARNVQVTILVGSAQLVERTIPALAPGQSVQVTAFKVVSRGEFVVKALASLGEGLEPPQRERDNLFSRILRVRGHDLGVVLDPGRVHMSSGEPVTVMATIMNREDTVDQVTISLHEPSGAFSLVVVPNPVRIGPNSTAVAGLTLMPAANITGGTHTVRIIARPTSNELAFANATLQVIVPADMVPPTLRVDASQVTPGIASLGMTIVSRSNVGQSFQVSLAEPAWPTTALAVNLTAGQRQALPLEIEVPRDTPPGNYDLTFRLRAANGTDTLVHGGPIEVLAKPDAGLQWTEVVRKPGQVGESTYTYRLQVANVGNVPFRLSLNEDALWNNATLRVSHDNPEVKPGETVTQQVQVRAVASAGTESLGTLAVDLIANGRPTHFGEVALPDLDGLANLVIEDVSIEPSGPLKAGDHVRVSARVKNEGLVPASAAIFSIYLGGALLTDDTVPMLAPGETSIVTHNWTAKAGKHHLMFSLDDTRRVLETEEADNGATHVMDVAGTFWTKVAHQVPSFGLPELLAVLAVGMVLATRRRT